MATGDSYKTISFSYRVGKSTIVKIIPEVCEALWLHLQPTFMPVPTEPDWLNIALDYERKWQFPNCIGSLDGKHVVIQAPKQSGTLFYNYKGTFSIVLMALVDANYCFTVIDVGGLGSNSDGGIFARSKLGKSLEGPNNNLMVPKPCELTNAPEYGKFPFVFVGDEAFPLKVNLMRPYPGHGLDRREFSITGCPGLAVW